MPISVTFFAATQRRLTEVDVVYVADTDLYTALFHLYYSIFIRERLATALPVYSCSEPHDLQQNSSKTLRRKLESPL
jgi:hypothetical protein